MLSFFVSLIAGGSIAHQDQALIAFVSDRDGNEEIYIMNGDGTGVRRFTDNPARDIQPCFSPDGKRIAWASNRGANWDIYVANLDGTGLDNVSQSKDPELRPSWHKNSRHVFGCVNGRTYMYDTKIDESRLVNGYSWAKSDTELTVSRTNRVLLRNPSTDLIWIIDEMVSQDPHVRPLAFKPAGDDTVPPKQFNPAWSQDGTLLVFDTGGANPQLYVAESNGENMSHVAFDGNGYDANFMGQSDILVFTSKVGGQADIYSLSIDAAVYSKTPPKATNLTNHPANDKEASVWEPLIEE